MKHLFLFVLLCTSVLYPITVTVNVHYDYLNVPPCMFTKFIVNDKDTVSIANYHNDPLNIIPTTYDSITTLKLDVTAPWSGTIKIIGKRFTFTNKLFDVSNATSDVSFDTYAKINMLTIVGKTIAVNGDSLSNIKMLTYFDNFNSKKGTYTISKNYLCQLYGFSQLYIFHATTNMNDLIGYVQSSSSVGPFESDSITVYDKLTNTYKTYCLDDTIPGPDYVAPLEELTGKVLNGNDPISNVSVKLIGNTTLYDTTDSLGEFSFMTSSQFHGYIVATKTNYTFTPSIMEVNFSDPIIIKGKLNTGIPEFTCKSIDTITSSNTIGFIFNIDYNNPTSLKDSIIILKLPSWLAFTNNKLIGINQASSIYDTIKLVLNINNINVDTLTLTLYMPNVVSIISPIVTLTKKHTVSQIAIYDLKGRLITICNPNDLNKIMASKSKMIVITKAFTKSFPIINKSISK
jgi:hypothetical protein